MMTTMCFKLGVYATHKEKGNMATLENRHQFVKRCSQVKGMIDHIRKVAVVHTALYPGSGAEYGKNEASTNKRPGFD